MDIKKISERTDQLKLLVTGLDTALLNSLRRTIMNAVPSYAAETVLIYENNSIVPDEMLAHRIGLLPVRVNKKKTKKGDIIKLTLEKEGPGNVYSSDISVQGTGAEMENKNVPLTKLKKGQKIKMEIETMAGTGKEHAKWQPALVSYKQVPKISFEHSKDAHSILIKWPGRSTDHLIVILLRNHIRPFTDLALLGSSHR